MIINKTLFMKKILSTRLVLVLYTILFATNCRKETTELAALNEEMSQQSKDDKRDKGSDCRLTKYDYYDAIHDFSQIDNYSYKNGLVDEWLTFYGILYKIEYDNKKKFKTARAYDGATLTNTIQFIYQKNKVVKEIWYAGNTNQVSDEVNYVYNQKGQMIYNESINFGYSVTYTYYENGNLKSWFYFEGGLPNSKAEYTYRNKFKNPLKARPGIDYSFAWANAAFGTTENWYSSEKITLYDELGNSSVYYDQNPNKTVWRVGDKNYPLKATYVDAVSSGIITNSFEYENCSEKGKDSPINTKNQITGMNNSLVSDEKFKLMLQGPQTGMIKKLKELGKRLKK